MRDPCNSFHLAIPCCDLDEAWAFYIDALGCASGRRYDDRITVNFFGDQLVCHLSPEKTDPAPEVYPRHFGVTLKHRKDFIKMVKRAKAKKLKFFKEVFVRFAGRPEEHRAFFLVDPSNNLVEFKNYKQQETMF